MVIRVAYARVSSREQAENSHALEQQIARLESSGVDRVISDVESGSSNHKSPGFKELMDLVKQGQVKEVVITRLDRLTRSLASLQSTLVIFRQHKVALVSLDDSIDTATAGGKFHINMLGALAEMEVDRLSERVQHGWHHLRERRVAMNPPFGYRKENDRHVLDHEPFLCCIADRQRWSRARIARFYVTTFLKEGSIRLTLRKVYEYFGIRVYKSSRRGPMTTRLIRFAPVAFAHWITNPVLQGHLSYRRNSYKDRRGRESTDWEIIPDTHEPIIMPDEADLIKSMLASNRKVKGVAATDPKHTVTGLVFCGCCRSGAYSQSGSLNFYRDNRLGNPIRYNHYFQCRNWKTRSCDQKKMVRIEPIEEAAIAALVSRAETLAKMADTPDTPQEPMELKELRSQLADLNRIAFNPAIEQAKQNILAQISVLEHNQGQLNRESSRLAELIQALGDPELWRSGMEFEEKRRLFQDLIQGIYIKDGEVVEVRLKI
jgi:site-specific DNA recombinase